MNDLTIITKCIDLYELLGAHCATQPVMGAPLDELYCVLARHIFDLERARQAADAIPRVYLDANGMVTVEGDSVSYYSL